MKSFAKFIFDPINSILIASGILLLISFFGGDYQFALTSVIASSIAQATNAIVKAIKENKEEKE